MWSQLVLILPVRIVPSLSDFVHISFSGMLPFPLKTKEIPRLSIKDDQVDRLIKQEVGLGVLLCEVTFLSLIHI